MHLYTLTVIAVVFLQLVAQCTGRNKDKNKKCEYKSSPCGDGFMEDQSTPRCCVPCLLPCDKGYEPECDGDSCNLLKCPPSQESRNTKCKPCLTDGDIGYYSEDGYKCKQCMNCKMWGRVEEDSCEPQRKGTCGECEDSRKTVINFNCEWDFIKVQPNETVPTHPAEGLPLQADKDQEKMNLNNEPQTTNKHPYINEVIVGVIILLVAVVLLLLILLPYWIKTNISNGNSSIENGSYSDISGTENESVITAKEISGSAADKGNGSVTDLDEVTETSNRDPPNGDLNPTSVETPLLSILPDKKEVS